MMEVEECSYLGEVGGSGVVVVLLWVFFHRLQMYTRRFPGQTQVPSPPLRELIMVCKVTPDHSVVQHRNETLDPFHTMPAHRAVGAKRQTYSCPHIRTLTDVTDASAWLQVNLNLLFSFLL